jgi:predicted RND superfamily exporter protein
MAPIKLEEHIREKIQEREIEPSKAAWKKLDEQLGDSGRKSPFIWYAIAASFIGVIIVASFVFKKENSTTDFVEENTIEKVEVESPSEIINNKDAVEQIILTKPEDVAVESTLQKKKENNTIEGKEKGQNQFQKKIEPKKAVAIAEIEKEQQVIQKVEANSILNTNEILENAKIEEIVAKVKSIQSKNNVVTEEALDALLLNAQRELQTQRILNNPKVDAMALLEDIEFEMERSFRDKVFDALGENFNKVRTAVLNRNN